MTNYYYSMWVNGHSPFALLFPSYRMKVVPLIQCLRQWRLIKMDWSSVCGRFIISSRKLDNHVCYEDYLNILSLGISFIVVMIRRLTIEAFKNSTKNYQTRDYIKLKKVYLYAFVCHTLLGGCWWFYQANSSHTSL